MKIEVGMKFKGNINGRTVTILKADANFVTYRCDDNGVVFSMGRKAFEHCDVSAIN